MKILNQKDNQIEITYKQYVILIQNGAVDTNEFSLFLVDTMTRTFNIAVARWDGSLDIYLVHIKIKEEQNNGNKKES